MSGKRYFDTRIVRIVFYHTERMRGKYRSLFVQCLFKSALPWPAQLCYDIRDYAVKEVCAMSKMGKKNKDSKEAEAKKVKQQLAALKRRQAAKKSK